MLIGFKNTVGMVVVGGQHGIIVENRKTNRGLGLNCAVRSMP
jgi:hypothetical protein